MGWLALGGAWKKAKSNENQSGLLIGASNFSVRRNNILKGNHSDPENQCYKLQLFHQRNDAQAKHIFCLALGQITLIAVTDERREVVGLVMGVNLLVIMNIACS